MDAGGAMLPYSHYSSDAIPQCGRVMALKYRKNPVDSVDRAPPMLRADSRLREALLHCDWDNPPPGLPIALVSGASGGIGSQIAKNLAGRGFGCILLGRRQEQLLDLQAQLQRQFGAWAQYLSTDLSTSGAGAAVMAELRRHDIDVSVLVNCAGFAVHGEFAKADRAALTEMLQVNIVALTEMTRMVLPGMIARGSGMIMNMSSVAAYMPGPLLAAYFASKAYVLSLSEALAEELNGTGVSVTAVCAGPTESHFAKRAGLERTKAFRGRLMPASAIADIAVNAMLRRKRVVVPKLALKLEMMPARLLPRRWLGMIVRHYHTPSCE